MRLKKLYANKIIMNIEPLIPYVAGGFAAIGTYFLGGRNRRATDTQAEQNAKTTELDNVQSALGTYREMLGNLREDLLRINKSYDEIEEKLTETLATVRRLKVDNEGLKHKNKKLIVENVELKTLVEKLEAKAARCIKECNHV